jgi:hypothetical protein
LAKLVPVVGEGGVVGVVALMDQPGFVIVPARTAVQSVGEAEQPAFSIIFEAISGLVRMGDAGEVPCVVVILGYLTRCIDLLGQLPECIVLPLCGLVRAVRVASQLTVLVVRELLLAPVGIDDGNGQVVAVVGVLGLVLQWVCGFDDVAALVVGISP